jgi:hypothetical protein
MRPIHCCGLLALALSVVACGGHTDSTSPPDWSNPYGLTTSGPGVLSVTPLDTSTWYASTPLGALAPPGHVLPTDHVYLYFVDAWNGQQQNSDCRARPVRAAGAGVVTFVLVTENTGDTKVDVQMTRTFHYYYDHVLLKPGIAPGTHVNAGDTIATTTGRCPSMDLGVYNLDVTPVGLVNTARYAGQTLHVVSPYPYFSEPLRSWIYARVRMLEGVPSNKDGRTDWGVRGRLVGDWFHGSLANESASVINGPAGWPKTLSFAYDWFDNTQPRISIGGTIATAGLLRPAVSDPDPASITVASGLVVYQGTPILGQIAPGWVLVQLLRDDRLRVEYVTSGSAKPTAFSAAAQEYVR